MQRTKKRINKLRYSKKLLSWLLILFFLTLFLLGYFFLKIFTLSKFVYIKKSDDGGAEVYISDAKAGRMTGFKIDSESRLNLSNNYGEYNLKNAWKLAENEKIGASLVVKTLSKNYSLPVYYYIVDKNSNLNLFQRLKISFSKKPKLTEVKDFGKYFSDFIVTNLAENSVKIEIIDAGGKAGNILDEVSQILTVMGFKISRYTKVDLDEIDCIVSGKKDDILSEIANVFGCSVNLADDIEEDKFIFKFGKKFSERF